MSSLALVPQSLFAKGALTQSTLPAPTAAATPSAMTRWDREELVIDGDAYFQRLIADIAAAQRSVDLESYIVTNDAVMAAVAEALVAAAGRGVRVRLLVDAAGGGRWLAAVGAALVTARVEVRAFAPLPWLMFPAVPCGWGELRRFMPLLLRMNRRNHRKTCVVDSCSGWVGSFNLTAVHSRAASGAKAWRDTAVRVEGPGLAALEGAFALAWLRAWPLRDGRLRPPPRTVACPLLPRSPLLRLNDRRGERRRLLRELHARIGMARRRVWISNAYLVPRLRLVRVLQRAVRRGADVRILVPEVSDIPFMPWLTATCYQALSEAGVRVYHYQPAMLHAKTALIDDWAMVGSSNLNSRSLFHDLEADAVLSHASSRTQLERQFRADLARSQQIRHADWAHLPWLVRLGCATILSVRHWV